MSGGAAEPASSGIEARGPDPTAPPASGTTPPGATCAECSIGVIEVHTVEMNVCWGSEDGPDTEALAGPIVWASGPTTQSAQATEENGCTARFEVPPGRYSVQTTKSDYTQFGPDREIDVAAGATERVEIALHRDDAECLRRHTPTASGSQSGRIEFPMFFDPSAWPLFYIRDPLFLLTLAGGIACLTQQWWWAGTFLLSLSSYVLLIIFGRIPGIIAIVVTMLASLLLCGLSVAVAATGAGAIVGLPVPSPEFSMALLATWTAFGVAYGVGRTSTYHVYQSWPAPVFGAIGFLAGLALLIAMVLVHDYGYTPWVLLALGVVLAALALTALVWMAGGPVLGVITFLACGAGAVAVCVAIGGRDSGLALAILMTALAAVASGLLGHIFANEGNVEEAELASPVRGNLLPFEGERYCVQGFRGLVSHYAARFSTSLDNRFAYDFAMPEGTPILAVREGHIVVYREQNTLRHFMGGSRESQEGNYIEVEHRDGTVAHYEHLRPGGVAEVRAELDALADPLTSNDAYGKRELSNRRAMFVRAGDVLAHSGNTGVSAFAHLHLLLRPDLATARSAGVLPLPMYFDDPDTATNGGRCWNMRKYRSSNEKLAYVDPASLAFAEPEPSDRCAFGDTSQTPSSDTSTGTGTEAAPEAETETDASTGSEAAPEAAPEADAAA